MGKARTKICFLLPTHFSYHSGGAELQVEYIIDYLLRQGKYEIYYLCRKSNQFRDNYNYKIVQIRHNQFFSKYAFFSDYVELNKALRKIKPDLIYLRVGTAYVGIAAQYCKGIDCRSIWHIAHQKDVEKFKPKLRKGIVFDFIEKKYLEYGIRRVSHIIGQAKYQDKILERNYKRNCDLIVPNFHPIPKNVEKKEKPIKIVWIANFKGWKQPEIFIQLARCFEKEKNLEFIMIGRSENSSKNRLMLKISDLGNLVYKGELPINQVNQILSESHIFVNTSKFEGFPNTFIQAWMHKVPVLSLNVDPDDLIKTNRLGYHSRNFYQMVEDIRVLIEQDKLREKIGERAQRFAFENFSISNIKKIGGLIEEVLE